MLDSNTLYCREIANEQTQQIRYLSRNGQRVIPKNFEQLNQAKVRHDENFNLLSTLSRKSPSGDFIIEVPISLHQVNLYATDGNFGKTLCFKKQLENLRDIENENKWERFYTYSDIRTYNTFWGVLQVDETNKDWQLGRKHLPVIQLFDYQGNPIAELKMDRFITSFDIDFNNGALYTLDYQEDEFYKYDIQDILIKCNIDDNE